LSYRLSAPFHLRLRIDFVEAGGTNVIGFFIQPETVDSCRLFTTLWRDDLSGDPARMAEAVAFEVAVLREDLNIQESFHELVLPLEPTAEVHTRADRTTLELRRVLSDLVATAAG
jgi:vanillate O-demethylase monooxygenase subunit